MELALLGFSLGFGFASLRRTLAGRESHAKFLGINLDQGKAGLPCPPCASFAMWILIWVVQSRVLFVFGFGHSNRLEIGVLFDISVSGQVEFHSRVNMMSYHRTYFGVHLPVVFSPRRLQVTLSGCRMFLIEDIRKRVGLPR